MSILGISHVAFADDLFILNGAHSESLQIILNTLKQFYGFSGLQPNLLKSAIYFAGVPTLSRLSFSDLLGNPKGTLPVKYLGSLQLVLDLLLLIVLCSRIRFWPESIVGLRIFILWWEGSIDSISSFQHSKLLEFHFHLTSEYYQRN